MRTRTCPNCGGPGWFADDPYGFSRATRCEECDGKGVVEVEEDE